MQVRRKQIVKRGMKWGLLLLLIMTVVLPVWAQESDSSEVTDDEVNAVAKEVYCPVCESTPLDVCETQACADWRELIREKLAQGQTKEEIFTYFADQYGDRVLATPPAEGLNLILWIWPVVAVVVGGFLFSRYMRNLRATAAAAPAVDVALPEDVPPPAKDDYVSRIEQELKKK
ncbi:MAG: cytochrome c-type biogenesis protein [Chloroflexota bacterium]|nr:cytochrome c-type biogenesis protein CcmH [Ardenticatenaceae bacterium]